MGASASQTGPLAGGGATRSTVSPAEPSVPSAPRLTKEQAAIIGAFTGVTCGPFGDIQEYAERKLGRPVWTHEFASEELAERLKELARDDFLAICAERRSV